MKLEINTPEEMFKLWVELSSKHKNILLHWDLWAWKTLLTKWFAHWLWIDKDIVQSPTYAYLNSYKNKTLDKNLLHIDMYRLESENDVWEKWINDQISNHEYIAIEWPKFINTLDIDDYVHVDIIKAGNKRIVEIK